MKQMTAHFRLLSKTLTYQFMRSAIAALCFATFLAVLFLLVSIDAKAITPTENIFLFPAPVEALSPSLPVQQRSNHSYLNDYNRAHQLGFQDLTVSWGQLQYSDLRILQTRDIFFYPVVYKNMINEFLMGLSCEKHRLMNLYHLSDEQYNRLAAMTWGILGNESDYFQSPRYIVKENLQFLVIALRQFQAWQNHRVYTGITSRGPTQIKLIPDAIAQYYHYTRNDLRRPSVAAITTLGFLAESLQEMRIRNRTWPRVDENHIYDYVLYIYMGSRQEIRNQTATPATNEYIVNVRNHMRQLTMLEAPAGRPELVQLCGSDAIAGRF